MNRLFKPTILPVVLAAAAACFSAIVLAAAFTWRINDQERTEREAARAAAEAAQTHDALCALKFDLQRRANDTQEFLDDLATGQREPIPGLTVADLKRSLNGQQSTLASLKHLECRDE